MGVTRDAPHQDAHPLRQRIGRVGREQNQIVRQMGRNRLCPGGFRGFLQHRMGVDPTKAEGVHGGAARRATHDAGRRDPGPGFGVQVESGLVDRQTVPDPVCERRRQRPVIERESRLDDPCGTRCRDAVPDHRLDRSDRGARQTVGRAGAEDARQRADLGPVAQRDAGAVAFDQPRNVRRRRVLPRIHQRPFDGEHLALHLRREDPRSLAVRGLADPFQHRIDPVAVCQGVPEPPQGQNPQALAHQRAVSAFGKGSDMARAGQGTQLVEHHVDLGRDRGVDPAGQHQVRPAAAQFDHCRLHRKVRR